MWEMARGSRLDSSRLHAQTDFQGPALEHYKLDAASMGLLGELVTRQHARQQRSSHPAQAPILIHTHQTPSEIRILCVRGLQQQRPHGTRMRDILLMIADLSSAAALSK